MKELSININIANRSYPLIIHQNDEELVRNAGKLINQKLQIFFEQFSVKDYQDALAMFALQYVTDSLKEKSAIENQEKELNNHLLQLSSLLETL